MIAAGIGEPQAGGLAARGSEAAHTLSLTKGCPDRDSIRRRRRNPHRTRINANPTAFAASKSPVLLNFFGTLLRRTLAATFPAWSKPDVKSDNVRQRSQTVSETPPEQSRAETEQTQSWNGHSNGTGKNEVVRQQASPKHFVPTGTLSGRRGISTGNPPEVRPLRKPMGVGMMGVFAVAGDLRVNCRRN